MRTKKNEKRSLNKEIKANLITNDMEQVRGGGVDLWSLGVIAYKDNPGGGN
ncbi:MAG: hypothetical protein GY757_08100 [bacterium]|nr:hypothetical protein [bacterium]